MHSKKETEFLEQKQENLTVAEYATKFEELVKFSTHYNGADADGSKCIKFKSDLRLEIKQGNKYQEIRRFSVLVNKCRIYDENNIAQSAHYKSFSEKKGKNQSCGKLYSASIEKGKQNAN